MSSYPPFQITPFILNKAQEISHELGLLEGAKIASLPLKLRRTNTIKTIQASLAIEGNTLEVDQITLIVEGKRIIGPQKDILEVKNAIHVYDTIARLNPLAIDNLLNAHSMLMKDLIDDAGRWRKGGVAILRADELKHLAPPAKRVPILMEHLFQFLANDQKLSWLIKACIFHYEFEFIHPFTDGNGRMGRLWQQLILMKENIIFQYIPIEVLIKDNQEKYYKILGECDQLGESTRFIEFSLDQILLALKLYTWGIRSSMHDSTARLTFAQRKLSGQWFYRREYLNIHKTISTATASRDLLYGLEKDILKKQGEKNQIRYFFIG